MAERPPPSSYEPDAPRESDAPPRTPRWVYAFAINGIVIVVVFVVMHLAGGGLGRHKSP